MTIQHKRGSASAWTSANPTLAAGQIGLETDTGKFKFGDGTTAWTSLGYFTSGGGATWGSITGTLSDQTDLQSALNGKQAAGSYAAASHTHAISDTTGLQTALDGKQPLATVLTNTTAAFTTAQETKLSGIAIGATANSSDATLLDRANHTGSQAQSTVTNLVSDLAAKQPLDADLTTIAGLTATTDNFMQAKAGAWASRTVAQVKTDLGLTGTNSGDQTITLTGDVTGSGTASFSATLATVNSNAGSFGSASSVGTFTVNGKGLITAAGSTSISVTSSAISDFNSAARAQTEAELVAGTNVTITPSGSGATRQLTIAASGGGGGVSDGDKGDITVTGSGATWTVDNGVVTLAKMADMATSSLIYRKTAGTGAPEVNTLATLKTDLGLTGTNSGDQTITLTGNVTGSGTGSFATTIAANVVANSMLSQVATATFKGRTTAGTGNVEDLTVAQAKTLLNLTGTNSGDQTITLTGDVTGSGTGSFAATIAAQAVSNAKLANVATASIKGRTTAGTGSPEDLTGTQATALLDTFTSGAKGLAPASGGGTTNFLRADGSWAAPAGGGGGTPAGSDTQIQYNNAGSFGGASKASIGSAGNLILSSNTTQPAVPPTDTIQFYARRRAGADWPEFQRPNGREIPVQPHAGLNRVATWSPLSGTTVTAIGMPRTAVGTASHPTLQSTNMSTSVRRWRMTSATTANSVADERSAATVCWRGNAAGLGGWTYINRVSLNSIQAASVAYFGLSSSVAAFSTTQTIAALTNVVGFGFTNGTNANWQIITNDAAGAPTLIDLGASFPVSSLTNVYTFIIYAAPNGFSIWVQAKNEIDGTVVAQELTTDIPANTTFLSVRNFLHNGGAAAAVSYDTSGLYLETDY